MTATNPHDSEEQLRPYLGRVFDAEEHCARPDAGIDDMFRVRDLLHEALDKALELLDVPHITSKEHS